MYSSDVLMPCVLREGEAIASVAFDDSILRLKAAAIASPKGRARINLHSSHDSRIQEMIVAFTNRGGCPFHVHEETLESYLVLEGRGRFEIDEPSTASDGISFIEIGEYSSGLPFVIRNESSLPHRIVPLTEFLIIHEVARGPFKPV